MKTTKLIQQLLLAAMMALLPLGAAAYDFMVDGIAYNKNSDGNSVSVTSTGTTPNYNGVTTLNIPPTVSYEGKTYNVTAIGYYGLTGAESIESLTLPEGLLSIGECGLNGLRSLRQLTLPSTLMSVSGWAFEHLDSAQSIISLATTAPAISGFWFHNTGYLPTCPFYVPSGSLSSYQASSYWKAFNLVESPILATSVSLNMTSATLYPDETLQLTATVSPGNTTIKTVAWASSDTGVATIDTSGKVTAEGVGSCTITATTTDGSNLSATCTVTVRTSAPETVEIGDGTGKSEVCPIHNWWLRSYQGNEVIYLKEELNLQPGDQITALSYHCVQGSANGGNFNVRIKNTTLTQTFDGTEDPMDPSVLKVDYNDKVYGNVQLEPYGAGDWITFELSEPFVYGGENIIIDIRNTAPGNYSGWCYFATTKCSPRRSLGWRNAQDEQVSGFVDGYTPYGDYDSGFYIYNETSPYDTEGDYPNIRITYTPGTSSGDVRATGITLNKSELSLTTGATETLVATISPSNTTNKAVTWASSNPAVATVDETGLVTAKAYGTATITATTTDGSNLSATCTVTVHGVGDLYGDINGDGVVDIADVNILINLMQGKEDPRATAETADVTGDGVADIADVNAVINAMLGKVEEREKTYTVNGVSFTMIKVEGGMFTMGATAEQGSDAGDRESPAHQVTLSSYSIGQTEVTQELWQAVMGSNPSSFTGNLQRPVEQVSWSDCQTFITKLNQMTGKNFRLPTEAEWEYAARGGNQSRGYKYSGSNTIDDVAWYDGNGGSTAQPVATKAPNELGLYDMSGNVYEWCQDWYGSYSSDAQTDPTGPATGSNRVGRGGCWGSGAKYCRVSYRSHSAPSLTGDRLGLRLAL